MRLVTLGKRHNEELTNILAVLCLSQLPSAAGTPLCSDLLVGGRMVFVIGLAPTMLLHFLHCLPGQSRVLVRKWNMALFVHADGLSPWAACKETHPWHSGTILSPLPLLLLLLLPLAFSAISRNEEWAPEEVHTYKHGTCLAAANSYWHLVFHTSI